MSLEVCLLVPEKLGSVSGSLEDSALPGGGLTQGEWPEALGVCTQPSNEATALTPAERGAEAPSVTCGTELGLRETPAHPSQDAVCLRVLLF